MLANLPPSAACGSAEPQGAEPESDEQLMVAYAAGSTLALERIFDRYAPLLLNVLQRRMADRDEARDLIQQTFLQLHRARADFDPSRRFRPWLFSIALNVQREHFRSRGRQAETALVDAALAEAVDGDVGRAEAACDIERALPRLSPEQREVVELHWLADLTFPEVATIVGATVGATRVRAHRAYLQLRALLDEGATPANCVTARSRGPY
jgi:RNA polymerase sigma-70 factor (ECF subfamily)